MSVKPQLHFKYVFGWVARIAVVLSSVFVARLINGIGHEFYASFIIVMALINLAPIFERGIGFYAQNKISSIKSKSIASDVFSKIFKSWLYPSLVYFSLIAICVFLFRDFTNVMTSLQDVNILGYGSEVLIGIGVFCAFLLAGSNIIQKGLLGLGHDYTAISIQAIPYLISGLSIILFIVFYENLSVWLMPIYFLFFALSLTSVLVFF